MKRYIIALAMLCLSAFATSAAAECAWVLWFSKIGYDSIDSAYSSLAECDRQLAGNREVMRADGYKVSGGAPGSHIVIGSKGGERLSYRCLPDTVDPRAPKGK
jgi:hypothetical protein